MSERNKVVPDSMLSKEFLSQFKTEADVSAYSDDTRSRENIHHLPTVDPK